MPTIRDFEETGWNLGTLIRAARQHKQLEQQELASMIGVSRPQLSQYETGHIKAPVIVIRRIAQALNISPTWLLGLDKSWPPKPLNCL